MPSYVLRKEPVPALVPEGAALMQETAEGSDTSPWSDHDDWCIGIRGDAESFVWLDIYGQAVREEGAIGQKS